MSEESHHRSGDSEIERPTLEDMLAAQNVERACAMFSSDRGFGQPAKEVVSQILGKMGLCLNEQKTHCGHFTETRFLGFCFEIGREGRTFRSVSFESLAEAEGIFLQHVRTAGNEPMEIASEVSQMLGSWLAYFYTAQGEGKLRELVQKIVSGWQHRFPGEVYPECLRWEALCTVKNSREHFDYAGNFKPNTSWWNSIEWNQSLRCLFLKLLRSKWWGFEYDLGLGERPAALRLRLGGHRINLRL